MDMQDNEFDDIFRSKLDGFEAEPSGKVWNGIDEELTTRNRRKIFMPILRIAASVIVLVTAGLLFIPHKGNVRKPVNHAKDDIVKSALSEEKKQDAIAPVKQPEPIKNAVHEVYINRVAHVIVPKKANAAVSLTQSQVVAKETPEPIKPAEQQVLAAVEISRSTEIIKPVVPDNPPQFAVKATDDNAEVKPKSQITAQLPANDKAVKPAKRHGIHNMGDLVNLVVAKVDKRKDKAIEFTDSDDDESTITAVNIGPVKIKKGE
jgi:hypothetical protein